MKLAESLDRRHRASGRARALRLSELVAAYTYPRIVELVEAFPKNSTANILKREIELEARA